MIQPAEAQSSAPKPALATVGCAGRLAAFQETDDGRYLITLTGLCRFRVDRELDVTTPYRQVKADYGPFEGDLSLTEMDFELPRDRLLRALKLYLSRRDLKTDWKAVSQAPPQTLVNTLAMMCPFEPAEKQALLEAPGWRERTDTLIALLEISGADSPDAKRLN
jgi:Lon protease-like protein